MSDRGRPLVAWSVALALGLGAWSAQTLAADVPLRFFPTAAFDGEGDGIQSGVRITRASDGSVAVSRQRFDAGGLARGIAVPSGLGGGFLFYQPIGSTSGAGTALFRASSWTGDLTPLGFAPFVVNSVKPGFDRFYLLGTGRAIAVDPDSGAYLPLDPLPPVVSILGLEFEAAGRAEVRAPIVGTLETSDAGLGWRPVPADRTRSRAASDEDASASLLPQGQLVRSVVTRGATLADGVVVALVGGEQVAFDPTRGVVERASEPGLDVAARCQALPPGELARGGPRAPLSWFVCTKPAGELELRAYVLAHADTSESARRLTLTRREHFVASTRVLASGRRGVLVDAPCAAPGASEKRQLCLLDRSGRKSLLAPVVPQERRSAPETFAVGGAAVYRISPLPDGSIETERLDAPGERSVHRVHREAELEALVLGGRWLPSATVFEEGISFWAVRGESYVGVRLEPGGEKARVGAIQRPLRRAFFSGSRALSWGASGFARISIDSGMTFAEVNYPFVSGDQDPSSIESADQALELGCGPAGCSLGSWLFSGWRVPVTDDVVASPERIAVPPLGGGRYRFLCSPVGVSAAPTAPTAPASRMPRDEEAVRPPPPFWERAAPRPSQLESVHSVGDHRGIARLYALGPKEGPWGTRGRTVVAFRSPFDVRAELESLPATGTFVDAIDAQTRLGVLDRITQVVQAELDPEGKAGVLLVRTRQQTSLFTFAERASVERFDVPDGLGVVALSGVVFTRGRFFIGHTFGEEFRIVELADGQLTQLAAFPLGETGARDTTLTRTQAGELGIALHGDLGLFVYPVSKRGQLGDVLHQPFRGSRPPRCPAEASGFLLVGELGISPYIEALGEELDVGRVLMRRVVGFGPECVDALAADARVAPEARLHRATPAPPGGTPLVLTERSETGRSVLLSCH